MLPLTKMPTSASTILRKLEATRLNYGPGQAEKKYRLLIAVESTYLTTASQVLRLHEHLCFLRAYPDNARVLARILRMVKNFTARPDWRRHQSALADTGIAGTIIHYRFFWPTARWLAARWPAQLEIDWQGVDEPERLFAALPLLVTPLEANWLRLRQNDAGKSLAHLSGNKVTDATFFIKAVAAMPGDHVTREAFFDSLDTPLLLRPSANTPSRTRAHYARAPVMFLRSEPPRWRRPELRAELKRPPRAVRAVSSQEGRMLIDLAQGAMVTRARDLDNFAYGDPRDVRIVDDGNGLQWAVIGTLPERRPLLRTTYGMLTLKNGVPIGYVGVDTLFRCADLSFNTFPTFRGAEAAYVFARTLAALGPIFGPLSYTIEPYQLGHHNHEGLESGAWWFYYRLGFRPRNAKIRKLARQELTRIKRNPRHRSSHATLLLLAQDYLYLETAGARAPYWPRLSDFGKEIATLLATIAPADRNGALSSCFERIKPVLGAWPPSRANAAVHQAWRHWSAILSLIPDIRRWSLADRRALVRIISAKCGRRDSDYLALFDNHPKLGPALRKFTRI
jgi:hypothetical protein